MLNFTTDTAEPPGIALLVNEGFMGTIKHVSNLGAAFQPLENNKYPGRSLFNDNMGGLNFEHIFNGTEADEKISWFTPRKDYHTVEKLSDSVAIVGHSAEESTWGIESIMYYTFVSDSAVDMEFRVRLHEDRFPLGYVAFMWASYMQGSIDRVIHFYGIEGDRQGWVSFGETTSEGFETGTIAAIGVDPLNYEENSATLNIIEHADKKFLHPFYYGLMDGDANRETVDDTMAYVMMFDQKESIRLAMWNFEKDENRNPDPMKPAWDWQFIVRKPQLNKWYSYKARMAYFPFESKDAILDYFLEWKEGR
jgi:hypothetical protein